MKKNLMFVALAAIGLASCNGGYKKGDGGFLYNFYTSNSGEKVKVGDFLLANLIIKNDADSVLMSTYDQGRPSPLILPKATYKGDIFDALTLFAEGDSATVKLPADSVFKRGQKPPGFKGKYLNYTIKIVKAIHKGKLSDQEFNEKITTYMKAQGDAQKNAEPAKLDKYLATSGQKFNKTDSGLYYVINKPGQGPLVAPNDTVVIDYIGKQLDGKVFDTSIKAEGIKAKLGSLDQRPFTPIRIPVGQHKVIAGWDQGIQLLNKGAKATLVIPSKLGYGANGAGPIAPYTPIVFEITLIDIIHPRAGSVAPAPVAAPGVTFGKK